MEIRAVCLLLSKFNQMLSPILVVKYKIGSKHLECVPEGNVNLFPRTLPEVIPAEGSAQGSTDAPCFTDAFSHFLPHTNS